MIVTFFEVEVSAWSNSKFCAYACEQWHVMVIIYLAESWVIWKNWLTLNSTHLKKNLFDCKVDVKHQKCLDLFWTLLRTSWDIPQPVVVHHTVKLSCWGQWLIFGPVSHLFDSVPEVCFVNIPLNFTLKYWFGVTKIFISSFKQRTGFS